MNPGNKRERLTASLRTTPPHSALRTPHSAFEPPLLPAQPSFPRNLATPPSIQNRNKEAVPRIPMSHRAIPRHLNHRPFSYCCTARPMPSNSRNCPLPTGYRANSVFARHNTRHGCTEKYGPDKPKRSTAYLQFRQSGLPLAKCFSVNLSSISVVQPLQT